MNKLVGLLLTVGVMALVVFAGCEDDREVLDVNDFDALMLYLEETDEGRELFRTDSLIPMTAYTKPTDPGAVFRDSVYNIERRTTGDIPDAWTEKDFGSPYGIVDDAEIQVIDRFLIHRRRIEGTDTTFEYAERTLYRRAYFLRIGNDRAYLGWVMHAFNGGYPRGGENNYNAEFVHVESEGGQRFIADGRNYNDFDYATYVDRIDSSVSPWRYFTDTLKGSSRFSYLELADIARIRKGERLVIEADDVDSASVYQLLTAETTTGAVLRKMYEPSSETYIDTVYTDSVTNRVWNLLFIQEFQFPDRPGGMWCFPYRILD